MSSIFEEFLRNFYSYELSGFSVSKTQMSWNAEALSPGAMAILPIMETDIFLNSPGRAMVIDAKYYKHVLAGRPGFAKKLKSENLYQLSTYMRHAARLNPGKQIDGALIYATEKDVVAVDYKLFDNRVRVVTIDLFQEWKSIHKALLDVPMLPFASIVEKLDMASQPKLEVAS